MEFGSKDSRVDFINSMDLMIAFKISDLREIGKSMNLAASISSVCILEFCKVVGFLIAIFLEIILQDFQSFIYISCYNLKSKELD